MPSTTNNYSLHIFDLSPTGDKLESFQTFRDYLAGTGTNSNMYIIDGKLKEWRDDIDALQDRQGVIRVPMTKDGANHYSATSISGISLTYPVGLTIVVIPDVVNDGTTILNINSIGDVALVKINETGTPINLSAGELSPEKYYLFVYDGTNFIWVNPGTLDQIFANGTMGEIITIDTNNNLESSGVSISTAVDLGGGSASNTNISTQLAVKTYVDALISNANALVYKGTIDCSTNPDYPSADAGWLYIVSVSGKIGGTSGVSVEAGDMLICKTDSTPSGGEATVGDEWNIIQKNIDGYLIGVSSSTDGGLVVFNGASGKSIKEGAIPSVNGNILQANGTSWDSVNVQTVVGGAISGASSKSSIVNGDGIAIIDSEASNALKYVTWTTIKTYFINAIGVLINGLTFKATPVDADEIVLGDSESAYVSKKLTISNLKLLIKTYYDGVTSTLTNKTLTSPIISTISNTGTITLPTSTDTLVGRATTDILTNKDLKSSTNTHEELTTITSSSSITPTGGSYRNRTKITALAESTTINAPSGTPADGNVLLIRMLDNGTSRTVAWNSVFRAIGITLLSATTANKTSYIMATYNSDASKWDVTVCITEA